MPLRILHSTRELTRDQKRAFIATFLGWMFDGFDFTVLTFILVDIQHTFAIRFVYPLFDVASGWRVMLSIGIVPILLVPWIRARVPESPVWLERRRLAAERNRLERPPIVRLFQRDLIGTTLQCAALMTAFMFSYYAITFWYATLLRSRGIEPLVYLVTLNLGQALGNPVWGAMSDRRLGRRGAITIAALLGVAAVPLFTLTTSHTVMWLGAVVMGVCGIGIWGMAPTYLTERFPTIVRGVGPGLAYHTGAAIGSITPTFIGILQQRGMPLSTAMALVIAVAGVTVAAVIWLGPETRGRTFTAD